MLSSCPRVVVLPLRCAPEPPELVAFAAGITRDLLALLDRLGDLDVVHRGFAMRHAPGGNENGLIPEADLLLVAHEADFIVAGELDEAGGVCVVQLAVFAAGRRCIYSAGPLRPGQLSEMRLDWIGEIAAAMGANVDPTAAMEGYGSEDLGAYRLYCLGTDPAKDPLERLALLEQAVEADPHLSEAWLALARALEDIGDSAGAREVLEELVLRRGELAEGRYHYAVALQRDGETVAAKAQVEEMLAHRPTAWDRYLAGQAFTALQEPARGLEQFEMAIEGGFIRPRLFADQGECFSAMGQHRQAIASWHAALSLDPDAADLLGPLALAHHRIGEASQSETLFASALEQGSDEVATHRSYAAWLQDVGRHRDAIDSLSNAISLEPSDPLLYNNRGFSRFSVGDVDGARLDFQAALERISHGELPFYMHLNLARLERGDAGLAEASRLLVDGGEAVREERSAEAIARLQAAISLFPESWKSWLFLALAYRQQGHWSRVADALTEVLRLRPDSAQALSEQGLTLLALGQREEAVGCAERAARLAPDDPGILANLALVCMEDGRFEQARQALSLATVLDPADPITERCRLSMQQRELKNPAWGSGRSG
jgi:tetratricopeptide (TPR) repeat protein